jgi:hypothetical protein
MRCLFCKCATDSCVSVEHIVPESLGNTEHTLPRGWVCDGCNNYFAREVEKPFLDSLYGRSSRFEMRIPNKKNRVPSVEALHPQSRTKVELFCEHDGLSVAAANDRDEVRWISSLMSQSHGTLYVPTAFAPDRNAVTSRFIGKIAVEILAQRCLEITGANDELVDKKELDPLRKYVRFGPPLPVWPVDMRRIYAADHIFPNAKTGGHEVLQEWIVLHVPESKYYGVIAIFGIEYAINLGGPSVDGYRRWLEDTGGRSPLYNEEDA